jgi:hypothetical protein
MENSESSSTKESPSSGLAQIMPDLSAAWAELKEGKITSTQFEQMITRVSAVYSPEFTRRNEPDADLLWKQYESEIDLYKHYLELTLKFNAFYYAVTGAIVSFYFTKSDIPLVKYALLFPVLMSLAFGMLFSLAVFLNKVTREDIFKLRDMLNLKVAPEVNVLGALLALSAIMMLTVAGSLLWFFFPSLILPAIGIIAVIYFLLWLMFR